MTGRSAPAWEIVRALAPRRILIARRLAKVFDVSGRLVRTLADRQFAAGRHALTWDGADAQGRQVARGVYFTQVRYVTRGVTESRGRS